MTHFYLLSGGGNDFLALVEPESRPSSDRVAAWCRRGLSVGADGLFLLERSSDGATMTHFNADGSPVDLCLNGTRCAVQLACHLGWSDGEIDLLTGAGAIHGQRTDASRTSLTLPAPEPPHTRRLTVGRDTYSAWTVRVGVPHVVLLWPKSLSSAPVADLGARLRSHPDLGPEGSNVDFVRYPDNHRIEIRTFERGVEAETLACGTGVMAAAAVGLETTRLTLPVEALTGGGFELTVSTAGESTATDWVLTGDARIVAEGELMGGAVDLPALARWSD